MAIIQYSDGTKIDFSGSPTQQDVENAYNQVKGIKSATPAKIDTSQMTRSIPDTKSITGGRLFLNESTGEYTKDASLSQRAKAISESFIDPAVKFAKSAISSPIDLVRSIMGKDVTPNQGGVLPSGLPATTFQEDFQNKTLPAVVSGEISPLRGTLQTTGEVVGGAGAVLGAADLVAGAIPKISSVGTKISEATSGVKNFVSSKIGGKTSAEILATPESNITKLSTDEQKLWYKNKAQISAKEAADAADSARAASEKSILEAKTKIIDFQQKLGDTTRETAVSLKKPAQQLMKDSSNKYVELTGEAADGSAALKKTIKSSDLVSNIESKFEYNPEISASLKNDLGISGEEIKLTNQQILDKAREIVQTVSRTAKAGDRVYTAAEYEAMQKYSFLMEQLSKNGVDMTKANEFWKSWAPVRDRIVREIKPFDEGNIKSMPITNTLTKAETAANTARQAASKLDAQNFITELETRLKLQKGSIGSDTRKAVEAVEKSKLDKKAIESASKDIQDAIKADKKEALKTMSLKAYDTERAARINKIIKRILIGLGIIGAAKATGLDRTILNVAGSVI